jgi:hypothetical protein
MLGFLKPIGELGGFSTFLVYFSGLMLILFPLQFLSAKVLAKKINFDADVEFSNEAITVKHRNKDSIEHKDWSWIREINFKKDSIWLVINNTIPFGIGLRKDKLSSDEIAFFELIKQQKYNQK